MSQLRLKLGRKPPDFNYPPPLAFPLYKSHGLFYHKLEKYRTAKMYYNKAIDLEPEDETPLLERCRTHIQTGDHILALQDAVKAMDINSENLHALYMEASALYMICDVETALFHFYRGLQQRQKPPIFDEGALGIAETEDICIGRHAGPVLLQHLEEIKQLDLQRKKEEAEARKKFSYRSKERCAQAPKVSESATSDTGDWWTQRKMETIMSNRYLGRMAQDYTFLKHLDKDPRIQEGQTGHAKTLAALIKETLDVVTRTKDILRVRKPFYAVKRMEATYAESIRDRRKMGLLNKIADNTANATKMLERARKERESRSIKRFTECAFSVKEYLDQTPIKLLPNKQQYLDILYNITGLTYLDQLKLDPLVNKRETFLQVEEFYGIQKESFHALPSRTKSQTLLDYRQILAKCEDSLEITRSELEKVWLHYEIARANHELGNKSEIGRNAIKKGVREAKALKNLAWTIDSCVLASRIEMKSQNRAEARLFLQEALESAKKLDNQAVVDFLDVCQDVVENSSGGEAFADMIEVRQKRILSIMASEKLRTDVAGLFNYMDTLPTGRRMSIVPGVKQVPGNVKRRLSKVRKRSSVTSASKFRAVAFQASET